MHLSLLGHGAENWLDRCMRLFARGGMNGHREHSQRLEIELSDHVYMRAPAYGKGVYVGASAEASSGVLWTIFEPGEPLALLEAAAAV